MNMCNLEKLLLKGSSEQQAVWCRLSSLLWSPRQNGIKGVHFGVPEMSQALSHSSKCSHLSVGVSDWATVASFPSTQNICPKGQFLRITLCGTLCGRHDLYLEITKPTEGPSSF